MNYQSCICGKCGHVYLPSPTTRFCSFCGAEVPKYEEQEITCPCCQGTGKIKRSPFLQNQMYGLGVEETLLNCEKKDSK